MSATDGFCSVVAFTRDELGTPLARSSTQADSTLSSAPAVTDHSAMDVDAVFDARFTADKVAVEQYPMEAPPTVSQPTLMPVATAVTAVTNSVSINTIECVEAIGGMVGVVSRPLVEEQMHQQQLQAGDASAPKKRRIAPTFIGPLTSQ